MTAHHLPVLSRGLDHCGKNAHMDLRLFLFLKLPLKW